MDTSINLKFEYDSEGTPVGAAPEPSSTEINHLDVLAISAISELTAQHQRLEGRVLAIEKHLIRHMNADAFQGVGRLDGD